MIGYKIPGLFIQDILILHFQGQGPPQSIPSSPWFLFPSEQVGQGRHGPPQSTNNSQAPWWQFLILSRNKKKISLISEKSNLKEIMALSETSFMEWDNDEDEIQLDWEDDDE